MAQITKDSQYFAFALYFFCYCSWGSRPALSSGGNETAFRNARSPNSRGRLSLNLNNRTHKRSAKNKGGVRNVSMQLQMKWHILWFEAGTITKHTRLIISANTSFVILWCWCCSRTSTGCCWSMLLGKVPHCEHTMALCLSLLRINISHSPRSSNFTRSCDVEACCPPKTRHHKVNRDLLTWLVLGSNSLEAPKRMTCVHLVDLNCPSCRAVLSLFGDLFLNEGWNS